MVLGRSWKKLRSLNLSLCLKVGTPKGSLLNALMYREVLLPSFGDANRRTGEFTRREGQGRHRRTSQKEDQYLRNLALRNRQYTGRRLHIDFQHAIGQRIKQYVTGYMKVIWGPDVRQEGLFSPGNIVHGDMSFPKNIRTVDCKTGVHFYSRLKADFIWVHVIGHVRVWRPPGEWYEDYNIVETDRYGGGSMMVWGGISYECRTDLTVINGGTLTALRNRDEILDPIVRPFAGAIGDNFIWCRIMRAEYWCRILLECAWVSVSHRAIIHQWLFKNSQTSLDMSGEH